MWFEAATHSAPIVTMKISNRVFSVAAACAVFFFACPQSALAADCAALAQQHLQTDLTLPFAEFDQNDAAGWRALSAAGCDSDAATLIEKYIAAQEHPHPVLVWHQAQMLAKAGNYVLAIQIARLTLRPEESEAKGEFQWNEYVNATIAFLQGDNESLRLHRERLAIASAKFPINRPNLVSVDRLQACFDKPYKEAYSCGVKP